LVDSIKQLKEGKHIKGLVSILMPIYNEEKYVAEAIMSVVSQDYKNIEIIIVNDGSTDKTEEKILETVNRIRNNINVNYFAFEQNRGKVAAVNKAFAMSTGEYIALLAGDDVLTCDSIRKREEFLENNNFDVVSSDLLLCTEDLNPIRILRTYYEHDSIYWGKEKYRLLFNNFISGGSLFFKRETVEDLLPIPEDLLFEDWWLSFLLLAKYKVIGHIAEPLLLYRIHGQNDNAGTSLKDFNKRVRKDFARHFAYYENFKKKLASFQNYLNEDDITDLMSFIDDSYEVKKHVLENRLLPFSLKMIKKVGLKRYISLSLVAKNMDYVPLLLYYRAKNVAIRLMGKRNESIKLK